MRGTSLALLMGGLMLVGCDDSPAGPSTGSEVAAVTVLPVELSMTFGGTALLRARVHRIDGVTQEGVAAIWTSSDTMIVAVSASGEITARGQGTTHVRATVGGRTGESRITVLVPAVATVEIDHTALVVEEGDEVQLTATPRDASGSSIPGLGLQWTSSSPEVAQVDALGRVTAVRSGEATIVVRAHDRTASAKVTVNAENDYDLLYSMRSGEGRDELYRQGLGAGPPAPTRILARDPWFMEPEVSPDGSRVAFQCMSGLGDRALCIADLDGGNLTQIAWTLAEAYGGVTWNHDGTRLAFVHQRREGGSVRSRIGAVDADGGNLAILTTGMSGDQASPAWAPASGGQRIAFSSGTNAARHLWTMNADGSDPRQLTTGSELIDDAPAWSPDGTTLAFQRISATSFGVDVWLMSAEGGQEKELTGHLVGAQQTPTWSPDGRLVAFVSNHATYGTEAGTNQIYTVWADGSKLARRTSGTGTKWSPAWMVR